VPPGSYTFIITDICGIQYQKTINVIGFHQIANTTSILYHCGSFDIDLHNNSNNEPFSHYWLQKYNPVTQQWGHPQTGVVYVSGTGPYSLNSIALVNNSMNYNFNFLGTFRILKSYSTVGNGQFFYCDTVVKEFTYDGTPKLIKVYSLSCNNGLYDVIVEATGASPLQYRIVEKDGQPYVVENGNSYIFLGIPAAHYTFQVEDPCGNILNSEFDVPSPFDFGITATSFCNGQSGSLNLPYFSMLQYEWWKDTNTATILSTTNSLSFAAFNSVNNSGVYHVRVKYTGNPNSCIDFVLHYTISSNSNNPHAGLDNAISYCGNQGVIDLFTLLLGTFDTNGTWYEVTNSGALTNNLWNSSAVPNSIYQFKYTVSGTCNTSDESLINVEIKEVPKDLTASVNPVICESQEIALTASSILNASYSWTGPNGFSTLEQNPIIGNATALNSGTYTVMATIGDCTSDAVPVAVNVAMLPAFTLDSGCEAERYRIKATPVNNSFDASTVSYFWNGPNNYTSTSNPIDITNLAAGIYSLIITDANGCDSTQSIAVPSTFCAIPNVITPNNDGTNDELDLSGIGVERIEIYNRWGRKVYEKNSYLKEWHGQNMQGNQLPDSTYYYYIKLQNDERKVGWIFVNGS
jgi:gliding motility-associated-like protein